MPAEVDLSTASAVGIVVPQSMTAWPEFGLQGTFRISEGAGAAVIRLLGDGAPLVTITLPTPDGNRWKDVGAHGQFAAWSWEVVSITGGATVYCRMTANSAHSPIVARSLAGLGASFASRALKARRNPICVPYSRVNSTTFAVDAANGNTFHDVFELAAPAYRVRPIFAHGKAAATLTIASCKVSCPASLTQLDSTSGNWTTVTLPSGGVLPVAPTDIQRRGMLVGDWTDLVNHNNSRFVAVRSHIAAGAGSITIGSTDTDLTSWASRTDGRSRLNYNQAVDGVTTLANFTSNTPSYRSLCIGVQYQTIDSVITIMKGGDSIDAGRNSAYKEESFWDYGAILAAADAGVKIEIANFAFASTDYNNYPYHISDACVLGLVPDIACFTAGSPNGISSAITDANLRAFQKATVLQMDACRTYGIEPVLRTWIPSDSPTWGGSGSEAYGLDDAKRIAWNNRIRATKTLVADVDAVVYGGTDVTGQAYIVPEYTTDHIHLNQAGCNASTPVSRNAIRQAIFRV